MVLVANMNAATSMWMRALQMMDRLSSGSSSVLVQQYSRVAPVTTALENLRSLEQTVVAF